MRYVIIDLEATCWEKGTRPERMEIIEIGAVLLALPSGGNALEFASFVRPRNEPVLSDFCKQLTGISQQEIDSAESFDVVFPRFITWIRDGLFTLCSWGDYDLRQLQVDCKRYGISFPRELANHLNLKRIFAEQKGIKPCGMKAALRMMGIDLAGSHHRAIDDARNIAKLAADILPRMGRKG